MIPEQPVAGQEVQISVELDGESITPNEVKLFFGDKYDSMDNQIILTPNQPIYSASINLPNYQPGEMG